VQVGPVKPKLKPPGTKRLKLNHDELLSNFDFEFYVRHSVKDALPPKVGRCRLRSADPPGVESALAS
jgi:hypothetical protein